MPDELPVHSEIGASSYDRWGQSNGGCPGSVRLSRGVEKTESEFAKAGTKAHSTAYDMLNGHAYAELEDPEEQAAVDIYVDYVDSIGDPKDTARIWRRLEQRFDLTRIYPGLYGTADAVFYFYGSKKLMVIDYKHGAGVPVDVKENHQLMYYGLGAMEALRLPVRELELVIVQPRCNHPDGPIRSWKTTGGRMTDFEADLQDDAKATDGLDAPLIPGDHCRWCPAKPTCPALRDQSLALAKAAFAPAGTNMHPEQLAEYLTKIPRLEEWIKGIREFAYREAQHGRVPPGFKLVDKRATRKWKEEWTDSGKIAREFGLKPPEVMDISIKSPPQVEKLIPKELKERFEGMIEKISAGMTLVPDSDPRPAANLLTARDVFDLVN